MTTWECIPVLRRDCRVADLMRKGTEIHLRPLVPKGSFWFNRSGLQKYLKPLLTEYGFVTTRTFKGDDETHRWLARLGFTQTESDDSFDYFMMTEMPFERSGQCPQ